MANVVGTIPLDPKMLAGGGAQPSEDDARKREFVRRLLPAATIAAKQLGVDPYAVLSQAALETGWGKSTPDGHNLFGIKATGDYQGQPVVAATTEYVNGVPGTYDQPFRSYESDDASVRDYVKLLTDNYPGALNAGTDVRKFADALKAGGYATDPEYQNKLVNIANQMPGLAPARVVGTLPLSLGPQNVGTSRRVSIFPRSPQTVPQDPGPGGILGALMQASAQPARAPAPPAAETPDPGPGGMLGGLMQASGQKMPEYHTSPLTSAWETLTGVGEPPNQAASAADTWTTVKGSLANVVSGAVLDRIDSKVQDYEQRYGRSPLDLAEERITGTFKTPNTPGNIMEARHQPEYQQLVSDATDALATAKEIKADLGDVYNRNPSFWGRVQLNLAAGGATAAPAIAAVAATKNLPLAMTLAGIPAREAAYSGYRADDIPAYRARPAANIEGAITAGSYALPMGQAVKYGTPLFERIVASIKAAVPAAAVSTIASEVNDYAAKLPTDMTVGDWAQAVQNGVLKLPGNMATAAVQGALFGVAGHVNQRYEPGQGHASGYEPGQSYTREFGDFMRAGAPQPAGKNVVPIRPAPSAKMPEPPVSGSPPPAPTSPKASAPISGAQGVASSAAESAQAPPPTTPPLPVQPQTTSQPPAAPPATSTAAPPKSAAPPAAPAPNAQQPAPGPQATPVSTTAQEPTGGAAPTETPQFKNWFGKSQAVDESGKPQVVYHATRGDFETFKPGGENPSFSGPAVWVGPNKTDLRSPHIGGAGGEFKEGTSVMPLYVRTENPLRVTKENYRDLGEKYGQPGFPKVLSQETVNKLKADGYDGVHDLINPAVPEYAVFSPKQLKSAIGNKGTFSRRSPSVLKERAPPEHSATPTPPAGTVKAAEEGTLPTEGIDVQEGQLDEADFAKLFGRPAPTGDSGTGETLPTGQHVPATGNDVATGVRGNAAGQRTDAGEAGREPSGRTANNDQPPRVGWREQTGIRAPDGAPLTVWRGSQEETSARDFTDAALGHATNRPSASLGVYHTASKGEATRYGPPRPANLDIRKPMRYDQTNLPEFDTPEEWRAHRAELERAGYDGVVIHTGMGQPDWFVAFHPDQVIHDPGEEPPPSTEGIQVEEDQGGDVNMSDKPQSRPEPKDEAPPIEAGKSEDPMLKIAARKAAEGQAALDRQAALTPPITPKRDSRLGQSPYDKMWYDLAPQAQAGTTPEAHAKQVEAWVERMRNAPIERRIALTKDRTTRMFGFKDITIDPRLSKREQMDILNDAYNNLSTNSALTGLPAESMGFNGKLSLKLAYRIGNSGTRGTFEMKFGVPFEESAKITLARRTDSFVHEWWHALDFSLLTRYYLSRTGGLSEKSALGTSTLSQNKSHVEDGRVDALPEPIREAFLDVMRSIYLTDDASVEKIGKMALDFETAKQVLTAAKNKLAALQDMANRLDEREKRAAELEKRASETKEKFRAEGLRRNAAAIRERNATLEGDIKTWKANVEKATAKAQELSKGMLELIQAKASHLLQGSMYVDKLAGDDPYYSLPSELLARSGESWIGNQIGQQGGAEFLAGRPDYYNNNSSRLMQLVYPNTVDRARIFQALSNLTRTLAREKYFQGETHASQIPRDTRIEKELWDQGKSDPKIGIVQKTFEATTEEVKEIGQIFAALANPEQAKGALAALGNKAVTVGQAVGELAKIYYSGRGRGFALIDKHKKDNPPLAAEIRKYVSLLTTNPGSGEVQGVTLERAIAAGAQMALNRVAKIAENHNLDINDPLQMDMLNEEMARPTEQVRNELIDSLKHVREQIDSMDNDRNKEALVAELKQQMDQIEHYLDYFKKRPPAPDHIRKAADALRKFYDEQFYKSDDVGIKLGYVSNFMHRQLKRETLESTNKDGPNAKGFVEQATKLYKFEALRKLRRLQIQLDQIDAELRKWEAASKRTGNDYPRVKVLKERATELRGEAALIKKLNPEREAEEYLYAARTGEMFRFNAATPPSNFIKEREFGPAADLFMKDYLEQNPLESTYQYAINSTRRIEYARRFGDDHSKRQVMLDTMRAKGMPEADIEALNQLTNVLAGYHSAEISHNMRIGLDLAYNVASMALLPLNIFNQLAEPMTASLRTRNVLDSFKNLGWTIQALFDMGDMEQMKAIGDAIGIISRSGSDQIAMARLDGADLSKQSRSWMSKYSARTGVHGYTNASRLATMKLGGMYIKSTADLFRTGNKEQQAVAAKLLNELGIQPTDHDRFVQFAQKQGNLISLDELGKPEDYDLKMQYIHAIHGFVDGIIGNPKASDKPLLASHPVGRFLTALTSFNMYFQRHHMIRIAKEIGHEGSDTFAKGKTGGERAKSAGRASAAAAQYGYLILPLLVGTLAARILRDAYANRRKLNERVERIKQGQIARTAADAADLAGLSGNYSQLYNWMWPNRYEQKSIAETISGSHLSFYFGNAQDIKEGVAAANDPNLTTKAAQRKAAQAFYKLTVDTIVPALLAGSRVNGPLKYFGASQVMSPSMAQGVAEWAVPKTTEERFYEMKRDQKAAEDALKTPEELQLEQQEKQQERADREQDMQDELNDYAVTKGQ